MFTGFGMNAQDTLLIFAQAVLLIIQLEPPDEGVRTKYREYDIKQCHEHKAWDKKLKVTLTVRVEHFFIFLSMCVMFIDNRDN